ncbi:hypothetical protein [uncultured Roseibium sp.]|uniref:hypothetical protein n=1 Tax=uncultured Roseibium sp. TaxID=1936171 RepID=UPI003217EE6B
MSSETIRDKLDAKIRYMIGIADELIALAGEENQRLAPGRPVKIDDIVARKRELVQEFETWLKQIHAQPTVLSLASPDLTSLLFRRNRELGEALAANTELLNRALKASRRRTATIVRAIREARTLPAGYSDKAAYRPAASYPISIGAGCKA